MLTTQYSSGEPADDSYLAAKERAEGILREMAA
jgi:hypothetical protein